MNITHDIKISGSDDFSLNSMSVITEIFKNNASDEANIVGTNINYSLKEGTFAIFAIML